DHHNGCALSHRNVIAQAKARGFQNVLVFEDDVQFLPDADACVRRSLDELAAHEWSLLYLGAMRWGRDYPLVPGCTSLQEAGVEVTCTHAVAVHSRACDRILADVPETVGDIAEWRKRVLAYDQYLPR